MEGEKDNVQDRQTITHDYYASKPNTYETMLGGFTQVHDADIQESRKLIENLFKVKKRTLSCLFECPL